MTRSPSRSLRLPLGILALWLGLWPMGDAVTGSSQVMVMPEPAAAPAACCPGETSEPSCCSTEDPSDCNDRLMRCCDCLLLGGLVFHTAAQAPVEPDPAPVSILETAAVFGPTRDLQPPTPPPVAPS